MRLLPAQTPRKLHKRYLKTAFLCKATQKIRMVAGGGADQFQCDVACQPFVVRPKDLAHASRADFLDESVVPNEPTNHKENTGPRLDLAC